MFKNALKKLAELLEAITPSVGKVVYWVKLPQTKQQEASLIGAPDSKAVQGCIIRINETSEIDKTSSGSIFQYLASATIGVYASYENATTFDSSRQEEFDTTLRNIVVALADVHASRTTSDLGLSVETVDAIKNHGEGMYFGRQCLFAEIEITIKVTLR